MQSGIVFRMTIAFAAKAHKSWPYTSVTNVSDELSLEIRAGYMLEVPNIIEVCYSSNKRHKTRVSVCALRKYFFHIGRKWEMNVD